MHLYLYIFIFKFWELLFEHVFLLLLTWLTTWFYINLGTNCFLYQKPFIKVLPSFFSKFWGKNYVYFFVNHIDIWYLILGFTSNLKAISFTICLFYVNFIEFWVFIILRFSFIEFYLNSTYLLFYLNAIYNSYLDVSDMSSVSVSL